MVTIFVHRNGDTAGAPAVDPAWLEPGSDVVVWVDLAAPSADEARILSDLFHFHPLSVEDALAAVHHPKVEAYPGYLYVILHGVTFGRGRRKVPTRDVDFFLGRNYLVTVHDGQSRSIAKWRDVCVMHERVLGEGPTALLHRIVDAMVVNYAPEIDALEKNLDELEEAAILGVDERLIRRILEAKRHLASLRRVVVPQRDVVGRLARREFPQISDELAYRFRDVYDQFVRITDEVTLFQDRVTSILQAYLSSVSNRLNVVMKVLTVISTIFLPLTVLTGMWGMNVPLPMLPGGEAAQFWWVLGIMSAIAGVMLTLFGRKGWL